jgi:hypothetical protein
MSVNFKAENLQKHSDLAAKIKGGLVAQGSAIKETVPRSTYVENLPEGITADTVEELSKYNGKFVTATHIAVGEMAAEIFKGDKAVEAVEAEVGYFGKNDSINISVARTKTFQNHLAKNPDEKEVVKHLVMQTTVSSSSVKGNGLKAVRDSMSEEFAGMFGK